MYTELKWKVLRTTGVYWFVSTAPLCISRDPVFTQLLVFIRRNTELSVFVVLVLKKGFSTWRNYISS